MFSLKVATTSKEKGRIINMNPNLKKILVEKMKIFLIR